MTNTKEIETITSGWDLSSALDRLGSTRTEIAGSLRQLGIKGERGACGRCPIAQWAVSLGFTSAYVDQERTTVWDDYDNRIDTDNSDAIQEFIVSFDEGEFPSLALGEDDD